MNDKQLADPTHGEDQSHGFINVRVRYSETDCSGVVYHSNYLAFCEVGRTELMREMKIPYRSLEEDHSLVLPVVDMRVKYFHPARYDDEIRIETRVVALGGARIQFAYQLFRVSDGRHLLDASTVLGCISADSGRPKRLPEEMKQALTGFLAEQPRCLPKKLLNS